MKYQATQNISKFTSQIIENRTKTKWQLIPLNDCYDDDDDDDDLPGFPETNFRWCIIS
jgi:hypothetical protein